MAQTVGQMLYRGTRVRWLCQECRAGGVADLVRIAAAKGRAYDLTDRTAPCRTAGCGYWVSFYAQDGQRTTALRTPAGLLREMDRRTAWLSERYRSQGMPSHER